MNFRIANMLLPMQFGLATMALFAVTIWPPASGRMLLIPLAGRDADGVARIALAGGALLLGRGPFAGSMVVVGDRSSIARRAGRWDVAILAAPPAGCGDNATLAPGRRGGAA